MSQQQTAQPAVQSDFLTVKELSDRYGGRISVRTLNNWRTTGNGPPFTKIGGAVLYKRADVERWEHARTVNSTSEYRKD